jgi:DNA-binding MarR family transcriptional regulator
LALAAQMVMDRTTLGRNIRPLERDGLIKVESTSPDRRTRELHLTAAGEQRLQASRKTWLRAQEDFESSFGTNRAENLRASLRAVVAIGSSAARGSMHTCFIDALVF